MGMNDAQEMLEAAQEECIRLERENAELLRRAERAETLNQITQEEFRQTGAVKAEASEKEYRSIMCITGLMAERDAALAVIEQVRLRAQRLRGSRQVEDQEIADDLYVILAQSPASALAKVKADVWDEGYTIGNRHDGRRDANPYREKETT